MEDAAVADLLRRHAGGGATRTHQRVARAPVEREVGRERLLEVDAWAAARGATIQRTLMPGSARPPVFYEYYLVPLGAIG
jgi:hypothetical protein